MTIRNPDYRAINTAALERAIEVCGGVSALAEALGIRDTRVHNWRKRGVPTGWVLRVSRATGGRVACHEFDPVAFPEVLGAGAALGQAA